MCERVLMKKRINLFSLQTKQNKTKTKTNKQNDPYREVEQLRFLWDDGELRAKIIPLSTSNVNAVHEDMAGRWVVQLLQ